MSKELDELLRQDYLVNEENGNAKLRDELYDKISQWERKAHNFDGIVVEYNARWQAILKLTESNKQLKTELERISDKLGNELQVKVLEIEELKQKLKVHGLHQINEYVNLKQKLSQINQLVESSEYPPSREQFQAILKGKE